MPYSSEVIEFAKTCSKEVKDLTERCYKETVVNRNRDGFQRDYARILYSSSFRRLQGKMQLLGIDHVQFHRNRLTHSLEVAQIARSMAADLGVPNHIVVESCSLAHDLGNPPFGHRGEVVLNDIAEDIGGFEGNAQTLRILTFLEKKAYHYRGLNLTFRTLLGSTKYFTKRTSEIKKFIYDDDFMLMESIFENCGLINRRSIDVQIMDIADEIAYAAHDLEDSLSLGYLTINELLYEFKYHLKYAPAYDSLRDLVKESQQFAFNDHRLDTSEEFAFLFRKELTSKIVNVLINDIHVSSKNKFNQESLCYKNHALLSEGLKKLLFKAILRKRSVQLYERVGEKVLIGLHEVYSDPTFNKDQMLLPAEYRRDGTLADKKRTVIDYISGMMDSFALQEYKRYFGNNSLEKLYPIVSG